jgi:hypothetical protein
MPSIIHGQVNGSGKLSQKVVQVMFVRSQSLRQSAGILRFLRLQLVLRWLDLVESFHGLAIKV